MRTSDRGAHGALTATLSLVVLLAVVSGSGCAPYRAYGDYPYRYSYGQPYGYRYGYPYDVAPYYVPPYYVAPYYGLRGYHPGFHPGVMVAPPQHFAPGLGPRPGGPRHGAFGHPR